MTVPMVPTRINGRWDLLLPEHRAARPEWTRPEGWERKRWASMHANLRIGDLVFDVGTEEGDLSALMAQWGCDLVLTEPNPAVWPNVKAIFDANGLTGRVRATWVGFVGADTRARRGWVQEHAAGGEGPWPRCADGPVIGDHGFAALCERDDIPVTTVDALAAAHGAPDALTIDVEGAELAVLQGAVQTLRQHKPMVWVSIHPTFLIESYGVVGDAVLDLMTGLGYRHELLGIDHEVHVVFHHPAGRVHVGP